jgi:glycosyltransferase involved in cell wall biosynthesis
MRRISVVLPVYNERESIAQCLRGLDAALAGEEHEILVSYDTDEDTTLSAVAAMPDRPASVRLVKNTLGRGALNAIRAGFAAAQGDVVVTSMADLSDPPEIIPLMAEKIRAGAAVVSGSRYMRGGSQTGGPWLKRTLSRIAGVSLRWISGIGTHDSTSNFRAYAKSFLETVSIESRAGFEIALELTVKAHLAGRRVDEVPSSWVERESGKSNFKLWKWLPSYLRWYLRAAAAPAIVLGVWFAMVVSAVHLVAAYGSPVPYMDDYVLVAKLGRGHPPSLAWLWTQHNEHRIPIAKLAYWVAVELTRDVRSPMFLQVGILAAVSLVLMGAARKIRGRTHVMDAFLPLAFLNWGHYGNLLFAFQLAFVLPAAIVATIVAFVAAGSPAPDGRLANRVGACVATLPLCSAAGLVQALPLELWMGLAGASASRSGNLQRRSVARRLVLWTIAAAILTALYLRGYKAPGATGSPAAAVRAIDLLALGAGPMTMESGSFVRALIVLLALATLAGGIARWRTHPSERWRELGLLGCGTGSLVLAAAIAVGRGANVQGLTQVRYVTLFTPFLALIYLSWCRYGNALARLVVQAGLCLWILLSIPSAMVQARTYAEDRSRDAEILLRDADAGLLPEVLALRHWRSFFIDEDEFAVLLEHLRHLGLPPFRTAAEGPDIDPRISRPFSLWTAQPIEEHSDRPLVRRRILGVPAVQSHAPTELLFEIPRDARRVKIGFGIDPVLYSRPKASTTGVRFSVEHVAASEERSVLFDRALDPAGNPNDRGIQERSITLPDGATGTLLVRVSSVGGADPSLEWGFLTEPEFD